MYGCALSTTPSTPGLRYMSHFPNEYSSRLVAEGDSKPCSICYKPTTTVLLSANKADFFYVCPMHLKDPSLASAVHPESYSQLLAEKKDLEAQVLRANGEAEKNRPYSWNSFASKIGLGEGETTKSGKGKEIKKKGDEEDEGKKDKQGPGETEKKTYQDYVKSANLLKSQLSEKNTAIANFQFKDYTLNADFYKARVNAKVQAALRAKRLQEIQSGAMFPSAPTSKIG